MGLSGTFTLFVPLPVIIGGFWSEHDDDDPHLPPQSPPISLSPPSHPPTEKIRPCDYF